MRGGGAQVAVMNMLYLLASVAQLLALRVLVVILSLWVLEDLCYKISVTRVREYGRCGCPWSRPWSAKTACCDHATSAPHQVAISHLAGRLPHNRVAISHFACRNIIKPFCIHFEVAISQWACRTIAFAKTGSEQTSVGAFRVHLTLCTLSRGGGRSALASSHDVSRKRYAKIFRNAQTASKYDTPSHYTMITGAIISNCYWS